MSAGGKWAVSQKFPYPADLAELAGDVKYRPGWGTRLEEDFDRGQGSKGPTVVIETLGYNTYHPEYGETYCVDHYMPVPPAAFDRRSWQRWLFDQFLLVERHEAMEFFQIGDTRPYAPSHGPGNDPYLIRELSTELDQKTSFRGEVPE
jgi:hypothetical protein